MTEQKQAAKRAADADREKEAESAAGGVAVLQAAAEKSDSAEPSSQERRDFLRSGLGLVSVCGLAAVALPFIEQLRPDAGEASASTLEVDISAVKAGEEITVKWRGQPVTIRNRAAEEVAAARAAAIDGLEDRRARNANLPSAALADDAARSAGKGRENWLVFINICTHLGCPTLRVENGWYCPCHGSHYDAAARVIKGPANRNMDIPPYRFLSDSLIQIG